MFLGHSLLSAKCRLSAILLYIGCCSIFSLILILADVGRSNVESLNINFQLSFFIRDFIEIFLLARAKK